MVKDGALVFHVIYGDVDYEGDHLTIEEIEGNMVQKFGSDRYYYMTTPSDSSRRKALTKAIFGALEQEIVSCSDESLLWIIQFLSHVFLLK
jgi:hypothetical protein